MRQWDMFPIVLSGLLAGGVHVLSGPDHLAAVLPLTSQSKRPGIEAGAAWGLGHGVGVVILIALAHLLSGVINIEAVSGFFEVAVGGLLIVVGAKTIANAGKKADHHHHHESGSLARSALAFGLLHGVAGAGHLLAAIPGITSGPVTSAAYGGAYLAGAVATMALFAGVIGKMLIRTGRLKTVLRVTGAISVVVGVIWIFLAV